MVRASLTNRFCGLEDALWLGPGLLAKSNAHRCMPPGKDGLGREIATPNAAREPLQLKGANKVAF